MDVSIATQRMNYQAGNTSEHRTGTWILGEVLSSAMRAFFTLREHLIAQGYAMLYHVGPDRKRKGHTHGQYRGQYLASHCAVR
eukprot:2985892-Rhodomonas_salina.1